MTTASFKKKTGLGFRSQVKTAGSVGNRSDNIFMKVMKFLSLF